MSNAEILNPTKKITKEDVVRVLWYAKNQEYPETLSKEEQRINDIYWEQIQNLHNLWRFDELNVSSMQKAYKDIELYLLAYIAINILEYFWIDYEKYWEILIVDQNIVKELKNNWLLLPTLEYLLFPTITENLWDLYYDTLASFLKLFSQKLNSPEILKASENISQAWELSKWPLEKSIQEHWWSKPPKHENAENEIKILWWIEVLAEQISKLEPEKLKQFLQWLANKLWEDSEADRNRPRINKNWANKNWAVEDTKTRVNLATKLLDASKLLKNSIKTI